MERYTDLVAHLEARADKAIDIADEIYLRLGGWLLAGHAGGLLVCLNALIDERLPTNTTLAGIVGAFSTGLISTFIAMTLMRSMLLHQAREHRLQAMALRARETDTKTAAEIKRASLESHAGEIFGVLALSLSSASFLFALNRAVALAQQLGT